MLRIFRTNVVLQIFIILIVAVLMWIGVFIHPRPTPIEGGGQLYYWITGLLSPLASTIIAFVLVIVEGVLLNSMLYRHKMMTQSSLMPLLFYIVAMSIGRPTLTPMLLGSLFLIIGMSQLMLTTTLLSLDLDKIFGASASIACATLFCPAMAVFLVPLIANMFNFSLYGWRDWTMLILGILAPYIVLETYYYMVDELFTETGKQIIRTENEIRFTQIGEILVPYQLSSGEKQMLAILLTVLVEDNLPYVLFMDEPEVSLHVEWQKRLIDLILELNPNVQIILTTHSPAVVMNGWVDCVTEVSDITV